MDMHHDCVLKKLNVDPLTQLSGSFGGRSAGKIFATMLAHLKFNVQHDNVLKKLIFDLLIPSPGSGGGLRIKYLLQCCCIRYSL